jgi:hypothetical protein
MNDLENKCQIYMVLDKMVKELILMKAFWKLIQLYLSVVFKKKISDFGKPTRFIFSLTR